MLKKIAPLVIVPLLFATPTAMAAKGGKPRTPVSSSSIAVSPTTPQYRDWVTFSGCGYTAGERVDVFIDNPQVMAWLSGPVDSTGCFTTTTAWEVTGWGEITASAYVRGNDAPLASTSFRVSR